VYLDSEENDNGSASADSETAGGEVRCTLDWPLVVIGDAGTNRVLVYTHSNDRFAEIILPLEEENDAPKTTVQVTVVTVTMAAKRT